MNVLLVEDHKILREGMKSILKGKNDLTVIAEANNGAEAIEKIEQLSIDLVIMDIQMPIINNLQTLRHIKEKGYTTKSLVLSMLDHESQILQILEEGAGGFLSKKCSNE